MKLDEQQSQIVDLTEKLHRSLAYTQQVQNFKEKEGTFTPLKLTLVQCKLLDTFVKTSIYSNAKFVHKKLLQQKPQILEKVFHHLGIKDMMSQQQLCDDVIVNMKNSLVHQRKYHKDRMRNTFRGKC